LEQERIETRWYLDGGCGFGIAGQFRAFRAFFLERKDAGGPLLPAKELAAVGLPGGEFGGALGGYNRSHGGQWLVAGNFCDRNADFTGSASPSDFKERRWPGGRIIHIFGVKLRVMGFARALPGERGLSGVGYLDIMAPVESLF
jgi:hypothetical protein